MPESAMRSSADLLGRILVEEGKYLWGVEGKVEGLQDELLWMRSFLRKADTLQDKDDILRTRVCQVQKYISEAEDIVEEFVVKVVSRRHQNGLLGKLKRYSCIFRELYDLHQTASSIDSLTVKISTLSPNLEKYGLMSTDQTEEARSEQIHHILKNVHMEDKKIFGLEKNAEEIIDALRRTTPDKRFHAIYGMGGSGKTTLATKVFKDGKIKEHFPGGQAFVYISKKFQVENVLQDLLQSLNPGLNPSRNELVPKLQESLRKKCLVVLDDVWTKEAWDSLKVAFALCEGDSGSKLLLTTRKEDVAKHVDPDALQKPDLLNDEESLKLLRASVGWELEESSTHEQDQIMAVERNEEKIKLGREMLKVCKGVPLAIVVLGGILRKKRNFSEWKSVLNNISSHLIRGYDYGRSCMEILLQSYDDLPYHLKPCFLHLSNFPEDQLIRTETLYWMWAAEGLVTCDRRGRTKSLEDFANDYLSELAQAGLVEIVDKTSEGWIQSIRMHDLVRDVCLDKATADNLIQTIDLRSTEQQLNTSDNYYSEKRLLRMAIYCRDGSVTSFIRDSFSAKGPNHLRSLFFLAYYYRKDEGEDQQLMRCICSELQLLRVLVLDGLKLSGRLTSQVDKLMHLRYLSLQGNDVSELPSSIGKLRFLEILDLRSSGRKLKIPNTLWKLFRLRHLLLPEYPGYEIKGGPSKRLRVDTLICLERIKGLRVERLRTKDLLKLKNLRKLEISDAMSEEIMLDIIPVLRSGHLQECRLEVEGDVISSKNPKILSDINICSCDLTIRGQICVPEDVDFLLPCYLKRLNLYGCQLKADPMRISGSLRHLEILTLHNESYIGTKISCSSESFPLLRYLSINGLENLEVWELEQGSMPKLEDLWICYCCKLNRIPDVLPLSLKRFTSWRNVEDHKGGVNLDSSSGALTSVNPYGSGKWLKEAVLKGECDKVVVILGKGGVGKATVAMKHLYQNKDVNRHFDAIARAWLPSSSMRSSLEGGGGTSTLLLPRRNLQQLLRDLSSRDHRHNLSKLSCEDLIAQIQRVLQESKCLVILLNLEVNDIDLLEADIEKTFGPRHQWSGMSKIVVTSLSDIQAPASAAVDRHLFELCPPTTHLHTWNMLYAEDLRYCFADAGIKWNMLRYCPRHPLSVKMFTGLLETKESIPKWESQHEELLNESSPLELSQIFALCYNDLPLHLRRCLIYLTNFPEDIEISTQKLYKMWIAAGFVGSEQSEETSLENLASTYLTQLVQRQMVTVLKRGPGGSVKACQLKFALRDLCLDKAKGNPMLTIDDQLDDKLSSLQFSISPTSLLFFPDADNPLYNEEKWQWFIYICEHFKKLQVLDVEGMWMTKGSLPVEIEELTDLRYLSLRGTWVTKLPRSIERLVKLQTLDLRVLESSISIPNVLWKLDGLMHLYLPGSIDQGNEKLELRGLKRLQTLVNLHTDKVCLTDLVELRLLRKISIRTIHSVEVVDELDGIFKQLNPSISLEVSVNSEIINGNQTILSRFNNLHKLKIKGVMLEELHLGMFPTNLKELTLKHTELGDDPLSVLEKLPELRSVFLDHESFLGKRLTFSKDLHEHANVILRSLSNLEQLYTPSGWLGDKKIEIIDCWRVTVEKIIGEEIPTKNNSRCFDLSLLKKVLLVSFLEHPEWGAQA